MEYLDLAGLQTLWGRIKTNAAATAKSVITSTNSGTKKIDSTWLPSYVDDVLEYDVKENPPTGKTAFPATGEAGKIYVAKDTNLTYRWSGTGYVEISPSIALGHNNSTAFPGDEGKALQDAFSGAAKDVVSPQQKNVVWTIYKSDGKTKVNTINSTTWPEVEVGYKVQYSGVFYWVSDKTKSSPTSTSGSWGSTLPADGIASATYTSSISDTVRVSQTLTAPKATQAVVQDGKVIIPTGDQTSSKGTSAGNQIRYGILYGPVSSTTVTDTMLNGLSLKLGTSKSQTLTGVTAAAGKYFVYAYPKSFGALSSIIQNGASPVLDGFNVSTVSHTNGANYAQDYYVYVSANDGAFTNAKLAFS